jgi:hypothetical protein
MVAYPALRAQLALIQQPGRFTIGSKQKARDAGFFFCPAPA